MATPLDLDGPFLGKTSPRPYRHGSEGIRCRHCGSDLAGRLEHRYVRQDRRWAERQLLVEVFLCPCRNGTRRRIERPLEPLADALQRTGSPASTGGPQQTVRRVRTRSSFHENPRPVRASEGRSSEAAATRCAVTADLDAPKLDAHDQMDSTVPVHRLLLPRIGGSTPRASRCPRTQSIGENSHAVRHLRAVR
jgi:hypothetical protein